jgi:raffinose/stachyose/melibiose transport system substrate-binding protein
MEGLIMKKVLATVLTASLMASLFVGCSSNTGSSENDTSNDEAKVVKVFQLKVEINDALQKLAQDYEVETGVKVEVTSVGGGADYGAALKAEFQKGTEPDIFMIQGTGDLGVWEYKLEDLSSEKWVSNAFEGTLDTIKKDGKIYGMPAAIEGYGLAYNKEILDKASIDPKSIDTIDKFKAALEKLESMKDELGLENVISYTTKETWVTGNHTFNIALATQENPNEFTQNYIDGKADIVNNQNFKDWMNLVDLLVKYGGEATLDTIDYSTQVGNFALGKTAFLHQGNWVSSDLEGLGADFDMGFIPLTINNDTKVSGSIPVGVPMYWTVNKDSAAKDEAKAFLDWMVTSETGQKSLIEDMKMIPAFNNFTIKTDDKLAKSIMEFSDAAKTIPWAFTNLPDGFSMEKIGPIFSKYAKGEIDQIQMLEEIQALTAQ